MMHRIQTPTPGRVVMYAPNKMLNEVMAQAMAGIDNPDLQLLPATVLHHDGAGQVRLVVAGLSGVYTARHGEVQPGEPPVGHWCYPPMVREETVVEMYEPHQPFVEHVSEDGGIISDQGAAFLSPPAK